jgi:hypothetical protein
VLAAGQKRSTLRPSRYRGRGSFARSQLSTLEESDEAGVKRRRLEGKQGPIPNMKDCQTVFQEIQQILPRVGKQEIQDSSILQQLQSIFPDRQVITAVACRGTDRTIPPPVHLHKSQAPFRKTLMILRPSGDIRYEKEWECWSDLSNRQMIRPAHPCRINITVFAKEFESENLRSLQVNPALIRPRQ